MEQFALVPPPEPLQVHVRVVPHAVAPLSPDIVPAEQAPAVAPHAPLTPPPPTGGLHLMVWVYSPFPQSVFVTPVFVSPGLQSAPL